jgi:hypothetical protein
MIRGVSLQVGPKTSPNFHRLYEERQEAFTAGQRWTGIAVLIAGQAMASGRQLMV